MAAAAGPESGLPADSSLYPHARTAKERQAAHVERGGHVPADTPARHNGLAMPELPRSRERPGRPSALCLAAGSPRSTTPTAGLADRTPRRDPRGPRGSQAHPARSAAARRCRRTSRSSRACTLGPVLGIHLGMSGHLLVTDARGRMDEGGDWLGHRVGRAVERAAVNLVWVRCRLTFADGGSLRLFDQRRRPGSRLDLRRGAGPDAQQIGRKELAQRVSRSRAPVKARLLDESGGRRGWNLWLDETLWQARSRRNGRPTSSAARAEREQRPRRCTGPRSRRSRTAACHRRGDRPAQDRRPCPRAVPRCNGRPSVGVQPVVSNEQT